MSRSYEEWDNNPLFQRFPGLRSPGYYNPRVAPEGADRSSPRLRGQRVSSAATRLRAFLDRVADADCSLDEARTEAEQALIHLRLSWGRSRSRCPALTSGLLLGVARLGKYVRQRMRSAGEEWLHWEDIYEPIRSHVKQWRNSEYRNYRGSSNPYPEVWEELVDMLREGPPHDLAAHGDPERVDIHTDFVRYHDDDGGVWIDSTHSRGAHLAHEYLEFVAWLADREQLEIVRRFRWWLQTRVDDHSVNRPLARMVYPAPYTEWADYGRGADRWLPSFHPYPQAVLEEMAHLAGTVFASEANYARALSEAVSEARDL